MFSGFDIKEIGVTTMVLFAVIDIIGNIPIILKVKENTGGEIHELRATLVSLGIMIAFLVLGEKMLQIVGVDVESFAVAGALILFALSLEMILGIELFKDDATANNSKTASIVPIAFPLIAGAGSMTTIISLRAEYALVNISVAIIINMVIVYIVLLLTKKIEAVLGEGGIAILKKAFGIILMAIAVKLFTSNVQGLFN